MANPNLTTHDPIRPVWTISGNAEFIHNELESAGLQVKNGTPVELSAGNVIAWDGTTLTRAIYGITALPGANLASAGAGASPLFGSIGFPGGSPTVGNPPPNQPNAVNLVAGTPFTTGLSLVYLAVPDTIFRFQVDASSGGTFNATSAIIGTQIGLTADSNGWWYADLAKVTPGTNTVLTVLGWEDLDLVAGSVTTQINNGHIYASFNIATTQNIGA